MLRFGILGAARIAPVALLHPAARIPGLVVSAVAASSADKARSFAKDNGIATAASSYAELINAPDIDAVYNALPPNLHEKWSIAALEAGKHVLCEKPFAMNAAQARRMVIAAGQSRRLLVEAFHYRYHPYFARVLELLANGVIGNLRHIKAQFDVRIPYSPLEFRHNPMLGGGALMDLGCYPVHWVRTIAGSEPRVTRAACEKSAKGVDLATHASLQFANGITADVITSMGDDAVRQHYAHVVIDGEKGRITLENPIAPHQGNQIAIDASGISRSETIRGESTYFYQLTHFAAAAMNRQLPLLTGGEDAIRNMQAIDAIYDAAEFRRPETR